MIAFDAIVFECCRNSFLKGGGVALSKMHLKILGAAVTATSACFLSVATPTSPYTTIATQHLPLRQPTHGPATTGVALAASTSTTTLPAGQDTTVSLGAPPAGTAGALITVTTRGDEPSYLTVWGAGPRPPTSTATILPDRPTVTSATVCPGADGTISAYTPRSATMEVTVQSWLSDATGTHCVTPTRVLDTRDGDAPTFRDGSMDVRIPPSVGVPATAEFAQISVTVVGAREDGWLGSVTPGDGSVTPFMHYRKAETTSGHAWAPINPDGSVTVATSQDTDMVVDVTGYVAADATLTASTPIRAFDSGATQTFPSALPAGNGVRLSPNVASLPRHAPLAPTRQESLNASTVLAYVTAQSLGADSAISVGHADRAVSSATPLTLSGAPLATTTPGHVTTALVAVPLDDLAEFDVTATTSTRLIVDVIGWGVRRNAPLHTVDVDDALQYAHGRHTSPGPHAAVPGSDLFVTSPEPYRPDDAGCLTTTAGQSVTPDSEFEEAAGQWRLGLGYGNSSMTVMCEWRTDDPTLLRPHRLTSTAIVTVTGEGRPGAVVNTVNGTRTITATLTPQRWKPSQHLRLVLPDGVRASDAVTATVGLTDAQTSRILRDVTYGPLTTADLGARVGDGGRTLTLKMPSAAQLRSRFRIPGVPPTLARITIPAVGDAPDVTLLIPLTAHDDEDSDDEDDDADPASVASRRPLT